MRGVAWFAAGAALARFFRPAPFRAAPVPRDGRFRGLLGMRAGWRFTDGLKTSAKLPHPEELPKEASRGTGERLGDWRAALVSAATLAALALTAPASAQSLSQLRADVEALGERVERLEDVSELERLQRAYGYYVDKSQYYDVADLFAQDATLEIGGRGVFVGKQRAFEYVSGLGPSMAPVRGIMFNHQQFQPITTLSEDGETASMRLSAFVMAVAQWGDVTYENTYVKEDGVWRIKTLFAPFNMYTDYVAGWAENARPANRPESFGAPPDLPPSVVTLNYPGFYNAPFHYPNPVTGRPMPDLNPAAGGAADMADYVEEGR